MTRDLNLMSLSPHPGNHINIEVSWEVEQSNAHELVEFLSFHAMGQQIPAFIIKVWFQIQTDNLSNQRHDNTKPPWNAKKIKTGVLKMLFHQIG